MMKSIVINDSVARVMYRLDPHAFIAVKSTPQEIHSQLKDKMAAAEKVAVASPQQTLANLEKIAAEKAAMDGNVKYRVMNSQAAPDSKTESLGKQEIEGVEAEGTRTTTTIPAGEIGNERSIQIVSERWFSPALQTFVLTKRSDPMVGETVYRLLNISRSEPDASLFQIPPGYTVKEGGKNRKAIR